MGICYWRREAYVSGTPGGNVTPGGARFCGTSSRRFPPAFMPRMPAVRVRGGVGLGLGLGLGHTMSDFGTGQRQHPQPATGVWAAEVSEAARAACQAARAAARAEVARVATALLHH